MKKIFILLIILMICTGCVNINNDGNKDLIIDEVINNNNNPNTMAMGYEYYLPIGFSKVYDKDYNQKLIDLIKNFPEDINNMKVKKK